MKEEAINKAYLIDDSEITGEKTIGGKSWNEIIDFPPKESH